MAKYKSFNILNIDYKKNIYENDEPIFELLKTKTNKYYLLDYKTKEFLTSGKNNILKYIYDYKKQSLKGVL